MRTRNFNLLLNNTGSEVLSSSFNYFNYNYLFTSLKILATKAINNLLSFLYTKILTLTKLNNLLIKQISHRNCIIYRSELSSSFNI